MSCKKYTNGNCCGKCRYDLISSDYIKTKPLVKVARIAVNISWMNKFEEVSQRSSDIKYLVMKCNGSISVASSSSTKLDISSIKYISTMLFNNWYKFYPGNVKLDSYQFIQDRLISINNSPSVNLIRTHLLAIAKYLEYTVECTGECTTIVPDKKHSQCSFYLSNINKIVKLSLPALVDIFSIILYTLSSRAALNVSIDLDTTQITCSGNILMEKEFTKCSSTLLSLKNIYTYYLSAWSSANVNDINKMKDIRSNIKRVHDAVHITEVYDISCQLLNNE